MTTHDGSDWNAPVESPAPAAPVECLTCGTTVVAVGDVVERVARAMYRADMEPRAITTGLLGERYRHLARAAVAAMPPAGAVAAAAGVSVPVGGDDARDGDGEALRGTHARWSDVKQRRAENDAPPGVPSEADLVAQVRHDMELLADRVEDYTADGLRFRLRSYADQIAARSGGTR